jgi:hypothetical protein
MINTKKGRAALLITCFTPLLFSFISCYSAYQASAQAAEIKLERDTSGPASNFRCPKLDLLPAGVTKNNFRSYGYASDFSFSQRPKYLRF